MRPLILRTTALLLAASAAVLLAACGSATKTVSVSAAPTSAPAGTTTTATKSSTTPTATGTSTTPPATTPSETRTATAPAFTGTDKGSSEAGERGASAATAAVRAQGYTPGKTSEYHPAQTLQVLLGTRTSSADGYNQRAFFFVDGRYIGTDASSPSADIHVVSQSDTEVTLAYSLYRPHDALCCPSGGEAKVRFQLDNGKLSPLDAIPPASSQTGLSRQ